MTRPPALQMKQSVKNWHMLTFSKEELKLTMWVQVAPKSTVTDIDLNLPSVIRSCSTNSNTIKSKSFANNASTLWITKALKAPKNWTSLDSCNHQEAITCYLVESQRSLLKSVNRFALNHRAANLKNGWTRKTIWIGSNCERNKWMKR